MGADGLTLSLKPADFAECRLSFLIRHAQHVRQPEGLGFAGEEEVLSQSLCFRLVVIIYADYLTLFKREIVIYDNFYSETEAKNGE